MSTRVPEFSLPGLTRFLVNLNDAIDRNHADTLSKGRANHSLLLQSPAGKVYEVQIDDAGVLFTTLISDTTP